MPLSQKQFKIDDFTYTATLLGAKQGRKLWLRLAKTMLTGIGAIAEGGGLTEEGVVSGIKTVVENLDEDMTEEMYMIYGPSCTVLLPNGNNPPLGGTQEADVVFNDHFAGRYVAMTRWLWEMTSFNFASFLVDMSRGQNGEKVNLQDLLAKLVSKSKSRPASIGSSGES